MSFNFYNLYSPYMLEQIKKHKPVLNIYIFEAWADCPLETMLRWTKSNHNTRKKLQQCTNEGSNNS